MILASSFLIDKKSSWDENKTLKEITFIQTDKEKKKKKQEFDETEPRTF